ncbi:acyl-CoA dehydrogenase [Gordonia sp. TBRC 11910]|uniref:Acyl-CoA dehydrogenase n=1 Tax=Gordonia asplenii TaxID=2725283 RepID=A0A848KP29_9ACTN|nr:acyl-CoA dehydrogenase family protein [Gordonia asplenii]NMO00050.1 acyl-CoA dehydrogenase [Gordonia asplenii]
MTTTDLRAEVSAWLAANPVGDDTIAFRSKALDAGWLVPTWEPESYGKGLTTEEAAIVGAEFERVGAPGRADLTNLHARVLRQMGTATLRSRYLRPLLSGEIQGCLLYSEPAAGSDLASLRTSAVREGDRWRINGQKVWTSGARRAAFGLLAARTDPTAPKHAGITFFVIPMDQPGIDVRPIMQITGDEHFNEVFLTDAFVDDDNRLGDVNGGWAALMSALGLERSVMGGRASGSRVKDDERYVGTADDLVALAERHGALNDPLIRDRIADAYAQRTAVALNQLRYANAGKAKDPAAMSMSKLAMSRLLHATAALRTDIVGIAGLIDERSAATEPPSDAEIANFLTLDAYFTSIGGGTDQIQRNIISERILRMPKEPDPSKSIPFNQIPS